MNINLCEWQIHDSRTVDDLNSSKSELNCQRPGVENVDGHWWCEFHAQAVLPGRKDGVLYARVSTKDQNDHGYSLPTQVEAALKFAIINRIRVLPERVLVEDISGAIPVSDRPEGKKLAWMFKSHQANAVIAYQVDRLSRDIVDLLASVRIWLSMGVDVYACDVGKIESELDIVLVIKGWQGSDERKKIMERTLRGKYAKARAGKVVGSGRIPYGYAPLFENSATARKLKVVGFVILEAEAKIIRLIYVWYVHGDGDGEPLSIFQITKKLSNMRIPTPGESRRYHRVRDPGIWESAQVARILLSETYTGTWRYGKLTGKNGKKGVRPLSDQIAVDVPSIVERKLWESAQMRREYNQRMAKRNCKHDYLLRGMIRCGCGRCLAGAFDHNIRYYKCWSRSHHFGNLENVCREKIVQADKIEKWAWDYVLGIFSDANRFEQALRDAQRKEFDAIKPKQDELDAVEKLIESTEAEATEMARGVALVKGGLVGRKLEEQVKEVERRYAQLCKRRDELKNELETQRLTEANIQVALQFREDVIVGMLNPTFADKRRILEILRVQVTVENSEARATCIIPIEDGAKIASHSLT